MNLLSEVYPNHTWNTEKFHFCKHKKSSQWYLLKILQEIIPPGVNMLEEYHFPSMIFSKGYLMIYDICIPSLQIIIEYHGYQHYYDHVMFGDVKTRNERDGERREACKYHNISYLEVPYWWKRDKVSIIAILHKLRPDIVHDVPLVNYFNNQ